MKILITSDLFDPSISGIVTSVKTLFNGLKRDGHDVRILTLSETFKDMKKDDVYYIGSFNGAFVYPNVRIIYPHRSSNIKELVEWKPDVIHTHCELSTFICANYISKKTQAPIVHTLHTVYEEYVHYVPLGGGIIVKKLLPNIFRNIDRKIKVFIAPTEKISLLLNEYGVKKKISIIPSSVSDIFFNEDFTGYREEIREKYGIKEGEILLLYLGRIAREKNIEELIDYTESEEMKNFRFMIAGDGPYLKTVKKYCKKRERLDNIIFTGIVKPEDTPKYYAAGDIFINASLSETQGLTYIEAMSCSLPVLCRYDTCLEGVMENERNGFVYKNREEFIRYALMLSGKKEIRTSVGNNARKTVVDKYSSDTYVKSCEKLYLSVLNES